MTGMGTGFFLERSAPCQRVEEISPEPLRQGHMPVIPELGQVRLQIGRIEIFRQLEPEQPPQPYGNIGIAAEIEKDLEGIGIQQYPSPSPRADL